VQRSNSARQNPSLLSFAEHKFAIRLTTSDRRSARSEPSISQVLTVYLFILWGIPEGLLAYTKYVQPVNLALAVRFFHFRQCILLTWYSLVHGSGHCRQSALRTYLLEEPRGPYLPLTQSCFDTLSIFSTPLMESQHCSLFEN
jgi:hypothetical protein